MIKVDKIYKLKYEQAEVQVINGIPITESFLLKNNITHIGYRGCSSVFEANKPWVVKSTDCFKSYTVSEFESYFNTLIPVVEKPIIYVDMDDTICDYKKAYSVYSNMYKDTPYPQSIEGFFLSIDPIENAIESLNKLNETYEVWIATRPSYKNPLCYTEKRLWVEKHLGLKWCNKLILCPDKSLLMGDYLIDDVLWPNFKGTQIKFDKEKNNWNSVMELLLKNK